MLGEPEPQCNAATVWPQTASATNLMFNVGEYKKVTTYISFLPFPFNFMEFKSEEIR
jgi:hypothetical protein